MPSTRQAAFRVLRIRRRDAKCVRRSQVLFSTNKGLHAHEIRDYALTQPECVAVEWNQQRTPGPAETPEWKAKDEAQKVTWHARVASASASAAAPFSLLS